VVTPQALVVHAADADEPCVLPFADAAINDNRLLTCPLLHSGQMTVFGREVRNTSSSNLVPQASHSYS
jgi:hypothetical protein